jgi:hypothetical protein
MTEKEKRHQDWSLEERLKLIIKMEANSVHCRTGSLERSKITNRLIINVHCRTGSLEMIFQ